MSVSVTAGPERLRFDGYFAAETLGPSTSTTPQQLNVPAPLTVLSTATTGGTATATGFGVNQFVLSTATAVEGQRKTILMTGTGEYKIFLTGTATGAWVMTRADDMIQFDMLNRKWRLSTNSGATLATST